MSAPSATSCAIAARTATPSLAAGALLARGVDARLARVCRSHARWAAIADVTLEELFVALADARWKGALRAALEERVADGGAARLGRDRWGVFVALDDVFDAIAAGGTERLERSHAGA